MSASLQPDRAYFERLLAQAYRNQELRKQQSVPGDEESPEGWALEKGSATPTLKTFMDQIESLFASAGNGERGERPEEATTPSMEAVLHLFDDPAPAPAANDAEPASGDYKNDAASPPAGAADTESAPFHRSGVVRPAYIPIPSFQPVAEPQAIGAAETADTDQESDSPARPWRALHEVVITVVAVALVSAAWFHLRFSKKPEVTAPAPPAIAAPPAGAEPSVRSPVPTPAASSMVPAEVALEGAGPGQVSRVSYSSAPNSASVVIDLGAKVQYDVRRLPNPERIYFDLQNTHLIPALLGKAFVVNGPLLSRLRLAEHGPDITRITLETKGRCAYTADIVANPYRLMVQLRPESQPR